MRDAERTHKLGVIPDLLLGPEKRLVDVKTVCAKKYYRSGLIRGAAGSGERRRKRKRAESPRQKPMTENYGSPVDERAQAVHSEYFAKAVACDREYNIYNEDAMTGPMCRTIGGRGDVIGMAFGAVGEASSSVLVHAKACAEAISKEAMSDGDVDAVTKDTGYGRVLGEIIRDWGVACAKRRAECLIKLVSIKKYLREPIISLNCLRLLCERGRATAPSGVLATLMGPKLPRELFVHVLSFWRSARALDDRAFDRVRGRYLPTRYDYWYCYEAPDEVIMG